MTFDSGTGFSDELRNYPSNRGASCYILPAMNRAASTFVIAILSVSTIFMVALPVAAFYAIWGIGGAIAGGILAIVFWLIMGIQLVRVRRGRKAPVER